MASGPGTTAPSSGTSSAHHEREVRRREQEPDPRRAALLRHLQRGSDAVHWDEAERARRVVVAAAGNEHRAEAVERRLARAPVGIRKERMVRASAAIRVDRLRILRCVRLCLAHESAVARRSSAYRAEELAVRLLARVREATVEGMDEDRRSAVGDRERVAPEPEREPETDV